MARIVQLVAPGGTENLRIADAVLPAPKQGELLLRQTAIGVNFVDVYQRTGLYPLNDEHDVIGIEGVGVVEDVGPGVTEVQVGQRVAYAGTPGGAYATERILPSFRAIPIPASLSDGTAATLLARGITVQMLQTRVYPVGPGTVALIHSAAGGLGSLLLRWATARGAIAVATVSNDEKARLVRELGADHVIVGRQADFAAEIARITGGRGVDVAYDGVGGSTLEKTLACVRPFGTVASFGQSAGPIPPIRVEDLGPRRSLVLARPSVMHFMRDPDTYRAAAQTVVAGALEGLIATPGNAYRFEDFAHAHADLEAGRTTGSQYLVV